MMRARRPEFGRTRCSRDTRTIISASLATTARGRRLSLLREAEGHAVAALTTKGQPTLRVPTEQTSSSNGTDRVVFENYDDQNFGYLRVIVDAKQLRIEYHPADDGAAAKTPDDSVTVDLATGTLAIYTPLDGTSNSGPRIKHAKDFKKG